MNLCSAGWHGGVLLEKKREADAFSVPVCQHDTLPAQIRTGPPHFVQCVTKLHVTSGGKNCLIDEQSHSLHVINMLLMDIHLSFTLHCKTQKKAGAQLVMEAPN